MSKSLKNFITIDVSAFSFDLGESLKLITAFEGNSPTVHGPATTPRVSYTALEHKGGFRGFYYGGRSAQH